MNHLSKLLEGIDDDIIGEIMGDAESSMLRSLKGPSKVEVEVEAEPSAVEPSGEGSPDVDEDEESPMDDSEEGLDGISPEDLELLKKLYASMG